VVAPLNFEGDRTRAFGRTASVTTTPGFKEAFRQFGEGGWQGLQHPVEFGGQGLPKLIGAACIEMLNARTCRFALCPLLTDGAIEALLTAGTDAQKALYLPKLISGEWTGTMNLTEPQAGSDLALVRTRAEPQGDGTYKIFGTEDLHHLRRARHGGEHRPSRAARVRPTRARGREGHLAVPGAEVPGRCPDGSLGARNDVHCVSSSTSSASRRARPRAAVRRPRRRRRHSSSARKTAASSTCSS
jgi:hypothetical protein